MMATATGLRMSRRMDQNRVCDIQQAFRRINTRRMGMILPGKDTRRSGSHLK
jgi:hypothetical protein